MRGRIRTVKPEIHHDEELWDLEVETGLPIFQAFIGLMHMADREGRFEWRPRMLKAAILPYWEGDFERVLDALADGQFIVPYEVDGGTYAYVRNFKRHQVINQREAQSTLPAPGDTQCTHVRARARQNVPKDVRLTVLARDNETCVRCGSKERPSIDHVFPISLGGTHALTNLRVLCLSCNSARPVAGQPLLDDLARDGLTMEDMPRMCMHVQSPDTHVGKGREGNRKGTDLTHTGSQAEALPRARARESASPASSNGKAEPPSEPAPVPSGVHDLDAYRLADAVQLRFRRLYLAAFALDPPMGGRQVDRFPEQLRLTATERREEPLAMLETCFRRWVETGAQGRERSSPYAAFVARFHELLPARTRPVEDPTLTPEEKRWADLT